MITQIPACVSSFREEEGGPELVTGSKLFLARKAGNIHLLSGSKGHIA